MSLFDNVKRRHHQMIIALPDEWADLPNHIREGLAWWLLIEKLVVEREAGRLQAVTAPHDTQITIVTTEKELSEAIAGEPIWSAVASDFGHTAEQHLHEGKVVAVCRFACDEPFPPDEELILSSPLATSST